jgi:hypothetical protein
VRSFLARSGLIGVSLDGPSFGLGYSPWGVQPVVYNFNTQPSVIHLSAVALSYQPSVQILSIVPNPVQPAVEMVGAMVSQ